MTRPCQECIDPEITGCQCAVDDSDAIRWTGSGDAGDPYIPSLLTTGDELVIDPVTGLSVSVALQRAANPARGVMRRYDSRGLTLNVSYQIQHQTSLLGGGMTEDGARSHFVIPYDGFYSVKHWVTVSQVDPDAGPGSDPSWVRIRTFNEDTDEEYAAAQMLVTSWPAGISGTPRSGVVSASHENMSAGDKIATVVKVNVDGLQLYPGSNNDAFCSKFSICYVGPSAS